MITCGHIHTCLHEMIVTLQKYIRDTVAVAHVLNNECGLALIQTEALVVMIFDNMSVNTIAMKSIYQWVIPPMNKSSRLGGDENCAVCT